MSKSDLENWWNELGKGHERAEGWLGLSVNADAHDDAVLGQGSDEYS